MRPVRDFSKGPESPHRLQSVGGFTFSGWSEGLPTAGVATTLTAYAELYRARRHRQVQQKDSGQSDLRAGKTEGTLVRRKTDGKPSKARDWNRD